MLEGNATSLQVNGWIGNFKKRFYCSQKLSSTYLSVSIYIYIYIYIYTHVSQDSQPRQLPTGNPTLSPLPSRILACELKGIVEPLANWLGIIRSNDLMKPNKLIQGSRNLKDQHHNPDSHGINVVGNILIRPDKRNISNTPH